MTTTTEENCSHRCGYVGGGLDLWLHERYEHADCTECPAKAPEPPYSLTHRSDCPRLQPGYVYPGPVPAEYEDQGDDDDRA